MRKKVVTREAIDRVLDRNTVNNQQASQQNDKAIPKGTMVKMRKPRRKKTKLELFFEKTIHLPYYYVGRCPDCGSRATGRFVRNHRETDMDYIIESSLKNGELVAPTNDINGENLFCNDCGNIWYGKVDFKWLSLGQIQEERSVRHTEELLIARHQHKEEEQEGKGILKKNIFTKFIGKI